MRCGGALSAPLSGARGQSSGPLAGRAGVQRWPCRVGLLSVQTSARGCARASWGWAWASAPVACRLTLHQIRYSQHTHNMHNSTIMPPSEDCTYPPERARCRPSRCSSRGTSHRQSRRRARSAQCGLRASGSAHRGSGPGTRLQWHVSSRLAFPRDTPRTA
jgi:hypothetical protein